MMHQIWLVFSLGSPSSPSDHWLSPDKVQHFFTSAFVQSFSYGSLRAAGVSHGQSLVAASMTTAAVGVGKEMRDSRVKGEFSIKDLTWDAAGAGVATVLLVRTKP